MKKVLIMLVLLSSMKNANAGTANYYRVWQGFKKPELSNAEFLNTLPGFMNATVRLYSDHKALNNYLVAIPPESKPDFVPDEFALVALNSEEQYKAIRATPEGQNYSNAHWDVFNKENSKSAPYKLLSFDSKEALEHNMAYTLFDTPTDWKNGYSTFYIGLRKKHLDEGQFFKLLKNHVLLVFESFKDMGLKGYFVIVNKDYEAAYMLWESREAMERAFNTKNGKLVAQDAEQILDTLMYEEPRYFNKGNVEYSSFYDTSK